MNDLIEAYQRQLEATKDKLSQTCYESLKRREIEELDELEICHSEFLYSLEHGEYYKLLGRIEKGEEMLEKESDPIKISQYSKLLKSLTEELERVRPG